ncbi:MAG: efflux RND transporter periplasmic adaptor subunit, partial [Phycisphaerae bacterium]
MKRLLSADSKKTLIVKLLLIIALAFLAGWFLKPRVSAGPGLVEENEQTETIWTCSMHPQILQSKPGKCPICFMDLIPVTIEQDQPLGPRQISFSPEAVKLMDVQTAPAERKFVEAQIRMAGTVDYDETGLKDITAWVPGRIDRLYVDFTGTEVIKGDHMVRLYSPDLISAQAEYIQAIEAAKEISESASQLVNTSTQETLKASREKLLLLGLQESQLEEIEKSGEPTDFVNINAPIGGIVIEKHATEGMYVQTGTKIYTIADLSHVWVKLDAYESDIGMITYQQPVKFTVEAYPGETFEGRITFKPPILDPETRTVKLRVDVPNPDGRL